MGDGSEISLWHDPWLLGDSLLHRYGEEIISLSASISGALLKDVITDGLWVLPMSNYALIMDVRSAITQNISLRPHTRDLIRWNGQRNVSLSTFWHTLNHNSGQTVGWHSILWNKFCFPRFSF